MLTAYRIEMKYGLITLALLAVLLTLVRTQAFAGLDTIIDDFFHLMADLGFVGMFILALVTNSSLLLQIPYTVPLLSLAMGGASLDRMLLMGIASGIGAGFGEIITYGMALKILGENPDLEKSSLFQRAKRMVNSHPKMIPLAVFVLAVVPLPDDMLIIPLAIVRYDLKRICVPLFAGKLTHNLLIVTVFYYFTDWSAERVSTTVQADLALGLLIFFVMMIFYQVEKTRAMRPSFS